MELTLRKFERKINISGTLVWNEPMAGHSTFRVGGPADCYIRPSTVQDVIQVREAAAECELPVFVLGGGANILVSDSGIRGIVLDMSGLNTLHVERQTETTDPETSILFATGSGLPVSDASAAAADNSLAGLDFIYSMPGTVGGAVWMNARCYGSSIAEILSYVDYIDEQQQFHRYLPQPEDWEYKVSPFQNRSTVILEVGFSLRPGNRDELWSTMNEIRSDRERKGHFSAPCAGSVFKNNRLFGAPSGQIIDSIGMRGRSIGGAHISDLHANIIVNSGSATARDIKALMDLIQQDVYTQRGILLEPEVLLVGEWD